MIAELIGKQLRFMSGAIAFAVWQHDISAGIFAYMLLVTLEDIK